MTIEKLNEMVKNGSLKQLHTSTKRGYVSRKSNGIVQYYKGKFGNGFILLSPNYNSTQLCFITYYINQ